MEKVVEKRCSGLLGRKERERETASLDTMVSYDEVVKNTITLTEVVRSPSH